MRLSQLRAFLAGKWAELSPADFLVMRVSEEWLRQRRGKP